MNYKQFVNAMLECIKNKLPDTKIVEKQEILRNNGVTVVGLSIRDRKENAAAIVYLEDYYLRYLEGEELEELVGQLIVFNNQLPAIPAWNYNDILDFQKIRHRVAYKLVNAKKNQKLLETVPNLPVFNLAIIFFVLITSEKEGNCSILIRNTHMNYWKLPISKLYECARENMPKLCPARLEPLHNVINERLPGYMKECPLLILSNETGIHGAAVILYPEIPEKMYEIIGGNYYLIPSSIHEFLILPEDGNHSVEDLHKIVKEVNETHLAIEDVLSDSVYYFNGRFITEM